jgi:ribosome-binding protein aMBF1 (putative translation factor)
MDHQDWKPVILHNPKKKPIVEKNKVVKTNLNSNSMMDVNMKKIEDNEDMKVEYVSKSVSKQIQQARLEQKMTQQDLANRLCVKKNIINELESGKMLKNNKFISKVKSVLNIKKSI